MNPRLTLSALALLSAQVLAQPATYHPATGEVTIPQLNVPGDTRTYAIEMTQQEGLTFQVTAIDITKPKNVQVGSRPYFLIEDMDDGDLKTKLQSCAEMDFAKREFSIGHRGAAMQYPEHTQESYLAAARMGAGIVECDVTFTKDRELVCRHSQCDLHTTTNILATPLAEKCSQPFTPAVIDPATGEVTTPASAKCCTSDLTLTEFKSLQGKMDASNPKATTAEEFLGGTADWRTDLYSTKGTLMSHAESIALFQSLDVKMTPELKTPSVDMPFDGDYTQEAYAQQMIDEYKAAQVPASDVFAQSFNYSDVLYWVKNAPEFGAQAVYLDGRAYGETAEDQALFPNFDINNPETWGARTMDAIKADGVNYVAPPMWVLVTLDRAKLVTPAIVPSEYAKEAKKAGLKMITWTLERSGPLATGGGWYYQGIEDATNNDGDMLTLLDVLAQGVGISGIFSDWPGTVTYYANCMGLE